MRIKASIGNPAMRTTLDIGDDVLAAAKERAAREKVSIGQALTSLARAGLAARGGGRAKSGAKPRGRLALLPKRKELVTLEHVRAIANNEDV
jgi:hypothetical protein